VDWKNILESLRTENIVSMVSQVDPAVIFLNYYVIAGTVVLALILLSLRMFKTIAFIIGVVALWFAVVHTIPHGGQELRLSELSNFLAICVGVIAFWIYMFFVRGD